MPFKIITAIFIDAIVGDPYHFPHPVKFIGRYIARFEQFIRRAHVPEEKLKQAGIFLTISTVFISFISCFSIIKMAHKCHKYVGLLTELLFMWTCVALKCLTEEVSNIHDALANDELKTARAQIAMLVSRDTSELSQEGIIKASIETVTENISDGVIAPLFYMFLGGAPLGMAYKAVNTLDSMVGYKNAAYSNFGYCAAKLDDIVNYIPARLSAACMIIWAFICEHVPGFVKYRKRDTAYDVQNGLKIIKRDARKSKSPNAGYPEAAAAGVLGIAILGDAKYFGEVVKKAVIGDNRVTLQTKHIKEAIHLCVGAVAVFVTIMSVLNLLFKRKRG